MDSNFLQTPDILSTAILQSHTPFGMVLGKVWIKWLVASGLVNGMIHLQIIFILVLCGLPRLDKSYFVYWHCPKWTMVRWLIPNNLLFYDPLFVSSFADQLPSFLVKTFFRYIISFYQSMKKLWCPGKHPTHLAKGVLNVQYLDKL